MRQARNTWASCCSPSAESLFSIRVMRRLLWVRRSGRKLVTLLKGVTAKPRPWDGDPTPLQLALARGHRWLAMLESRQVKLLREIARKVGVDSSYVSRTVNLTTLAPDIVPAILDETLPPDVTVFYLAVDPPLLREGQRRRIRMPI